MSTAVNTGWRWIACAIASFVLQGVASAQSWKPERAIEITVGSGPASGTDRTARLAQKLMMEHKLLDVPVNVVNRPGGGSAIALAFLSQRPGDGHLFNLGSFNLITNHLTGKSKLSYADFTPLAHLFNEYVSFSVRADSPITSAKDLIDRMRRDPASVSAGLSSSVAGANHIAWAMAMKAAGVDISKLKIVVFNSGGESVTALLGGHVDVVVVGAASVVKLKEEGRANPLAIASPQRLGGALSSVPTLRETGLPVIASNWRNAVGAKGLSKPQVAYWDQLLGRMAQTPEWKEYLDQNFSDNAYRDSAATYKYISEENAAIRAILTELGLAKL
jgi:putative tricarboxylic transport membrane protein